MSFFGRNELVGPLKVSGASWSYYGLKAQANNSTIFVAPQGIGNGWGNSNDADLKLTDDLIKLIEGDLCVDTTQVFSVGFSYGGSMSYALACARPTVFRAVAVYSGGVLSGCEGGTQPVPYLGIHGVSDGTLPISGGRSMRDRFVKNNGCTSMSPPRAQRRQREAHLHALSRMQGGLSRRMVRLRRRPHARQRGRRRRRWRQDLDQGRGLEVLHAVPVSDRAPGAPAPGPGPF